MGKDKSEYLYYFSKNLIKLDTIQQWRFEINEIVSVRSKLLVNYLEEISSTDRKNFYDKINKQGIIINSIPEFELYVTNNLRDQDKEKEVKEFISDADLLNELIRMAMNVNKTPLDINEINQIIYKSIINSSFLDYIREINKTSFHINSFALAQYENRLDEDNIEFKEEFLLDLFYKFIMDDSSLLENLNDKIGFISRLDDKNILENFYIKYISKTILMKDFHGNTVRRIKNNLKKLLESDEINSYRYIFKEIVSNLINDGSFYSNKEISSIKKIIMENKLKEE
jgi:hypothetical protein